MYAIWSVSAALACGLSAAPLRSIFRLSVASGQPDRSACADCGRWPFGIVPAPRGRCRFCRGQVGPRWAGVELLSAAAGAVIGAVRGPGIETVSLLAITAIGVALAIVDIRAYRLPNPLIGWAAVLTATGLCAALLTGDWRHPAAALLGAAGMSAGYLMLAIVGRGQLGLGDVKLALVLGATLGWFGWRFVVIGACLPFLLSAVWVLVLLALRRISRRSSIPFGPFMLAATALTVLL
jgi:leader peptidase (prepilin peptidase)/N-methyltransferase